VICAFHHLQLELSKSRRMGEACGKNEEDVRRVSVIGMKVRRKKATRKTQN
jgi:hypothetical protein